jgi:hypothetical protein
VLSEDRREVLKAEFQLLRGRFIACHCSLSFWELFLDEEQIRIAGSLPE